MRWFFRRDDRAGSDDEKTFLLNELRPWHILKRSALEIDEAEYPGKQAANVSTRHDRAPDAAQGPERTGQGRLLPRGIDTHLAWYGSLIAGERQSSCAVVEGP